MYDIRKSAITTGAFVALAWLGAPAAGQGFGAAVAVADGEILVGETGGQTSNGSVFLYRETAEGWSETGVLEASDAEDGDGFGRLVAVAGDRLLVGSSDAAYIFERRDGTWSETGRIAIEAGIGSGSSALLSGDLALVAPGRRGFGGGGEPGVVIALERAADGSWSRTGTLRAGDADGPDGFGSALAMLGDRLLVGAPGATVGGEEGAGTVHVFERGPAGAWNPVGELPAPSPGDRRGYGAALLVDETAEGNRVFVSAPDLGASGVVYGWQLPGDESERIRPPILFQAPITAVQATFGTSLAMVGDELWIGAVADEDRHGQVLRYAPEGDGWRLAGTLAGEELERNSRFGSPIASSGDVVVVSAPGKDYRAGTAYIFERDGSAWAQADEVWSEVEGYAAISGGEVACENGDAGGWSCEEVDVLSFVPVGDLGAGRGVRTNDVWGWTDPDTGREYALVGMTDQASFVDITDPENPRYVGRLPMPETANGSTWRDIKVYRDHAFIVSDGAGDHGMQVFDLTRLRDVGSEPVTFEVDAHYDGIASAHNIVINEASGFAYSVGSSGGGETCGGGLHMIDIREPTNPTFVGCFADVSTGRRGTGYSHDAMCVEYDGPDAEHVGKEICFGANETDLSIADVSDKDAPVALAAASYPNVGYAHQGWISENHRYFYLDDELDEIQQERNETPFPGTRTMIWDIADLDDPVLVKEHFGVSTASDHNLYIRGNLMYQSNYNSGLRILDISDPENPVEVGFLDTVPYAEGPAMGGSWSNYPYFPSGSIIVTSGSEGLFVVKYRQPELVP